MIYNLGRGIVSLRLEEEEGYYMIFLSKLTNVAPRAASIGKPLSEEHKRAEDDTICLLTEDKDQAYALMRAFVPNWEPPVPEWERVSG